MDAQLGRANTCLRCCCYLCLVGLGPATQPFWLSPMRMVRPHTHGARKGYGARAGRRWTHGLASVVNPLGGACKLVTYNSSGQSVAWTIRTVVNSCRSNRLVDNLQVDITTIHRFFHESTGLGVWLKCQYSVFQFLVISMSYWRIPFYLPHV